MDGNALLIEDSETRRAVVLPRSMESLISLMDGSLPISQIISRLFEQEIRVPFQKMWECMDRLLEGGCLEAPTREEFTVRTEKTPLEKKPAWWSYVSFRKIILSRLTWSLFQPLQNKIVFYTVSFSFSAATVLVAIRGYKTPASGHFLTGDKSYLSGVLTFWLMCSALLTLRSLVQCVLLLLATGRVYHVSLNLSPFGCWLGCGEESLSLIASRRVTLVFRIVLFFSHVFWAGLLASTMEWAFMDDLRLVVVILTLLDLHPYDQSTFTWLFGFMTRNEQAGEWKMFLKRRFLYFLFFWKKIPHGRRGLLFYSAFALAWSACGLLFSGYLYQQNDLLLIDAIRDPVRSFWDCWMATALLLSLALLFFGFIVDLSGTLLGNLLSFRMNWIHHLFRKLLISGEKFPDMTGVSDLMARHPYLRKTNPGLLEFLLKNGEVRRLLPGARVLITGFANHEVVLLIKGHLSVQKREQTGGLRKITSLEPGEFIGEHCLVGEQVPGVDILAAGMAWVFAIPLGVFQEALENPSLRPDVEALIRQINWSRALSAAELWHSMPQELAPLFVLRGQPQLVNPGVDIVVQGEHLTHAYLLVEGEAEFWRDGQLEKEISEPTCFFSRALVVETSASYTIKSKAHTRVLKLDRASFWTLISTYPDLASILDLPLNN